LWLRLELRSPLELELWLWMLLDELDEWLRSSVELELLLDEFELEELLELWVFSYCSTSCLRFSLQSEVSDFPFENLQTLI